jgi:uncharacterized protein involved in exopolysaccharide biosynthesis
MHIIQFYRILWAKRLLIIATTISCLIGGFILTKILPPRYESHARVMLGLLKPDPVTGQMFGGQAAGAYVSTQMALITDYTVAGQVADALGWPSDPGLINAYAHRNKKDQRDFHHWVAQRVIDGTKLRLSEGSNILDIVFTATNPNDARAIAEVLQKAYLDTSLAMRRESATRGAEWFEAQAVTAKGLLNKAEDEKVAYERANNVMMQDDKQDIESARLQSLTTQGTNTAPPIPPPVLSSQSAIELAQTDATIAQQSKILGPNHPDLQALKEHRAALAAVVAKDDALRRAAYNQMLSANETNEKAARRAIDIQKNSVIAQSDKLERLKQLQAEVNLRRQQLDKANSSAAELRQQAAAVDTGLSILGHASTPSAPSFPNMMMIVPGSTMLGFMFGVLVALLTELLARRVRGVEDLENLEYAHVIAVLPSPHPSRITTWIRRQSSRLPWRPTGKSMVPV